MNIREHKFFDGCSVKVARQAKEAFEAMSKDMDKPTKEKSLKRLNAELDVIMGNGYFYEYYLFTYIVQYTLMLRRLISVQGLSAYSYVAYLLGITTVNPVERDYPMEILFGYHHDRTPWFDIYTSPSFKPEILEFLYRNNEPDFPPYKFLAAGTGSSIAARHFILYSAGDSLSGRYLPRDY